jgi:hypothetical protein
VGTNSCPPRIPKRRMETAGRVPGDDPCENAEGVKRTARRKAAQSEW